MDRNDRLTELKRLGNIHGSTLSTDNVFSEWQGRISALLSYDPIAKHKFDHCCDYILEEHEFGCGLISHEVVDAEKKIHALIERAIADLEINVPDKPKPVRRESPSIDAFGRVVPLPKIHATPIKKEMSKNSLTKEDGLVWFWHHCHYLVKWRFIALVVPLITTIFWLGWVANEQEFFRDISRAFQKLQAPP